MSGIIIIGASHAGLSCLEKLRQFGYEGQITLIERDKGLPIQRPPLSKAYLWADEADEESYALRRPAFFEQMQVDFRDGVSVAQIKADDRQIVLSDGTSLDYTNLIIATGATPRHLPNLSKDITGIHVLRTAEDARALRASMSDTTSAIVIGGGYIGLEAAASLTKHGIQVHVLELADRLLARVASAPISEFYAALHGEHGVEVHLGAMAHSFETKEGKISSVVLNDGRKIDCQMLLVGIGVNPDMELAQEAGLDTGNGILVDADYRTTAQSIFAIGDVACSEARWGMRIESIHHAQFSGALVASILTEAKPPVNEAAWFWSDQYDVKLQIAGLLPPADTPGLVHQRRVGRKDGSFSIWSWQDGILKAVESANDPKAYMVGKTCLEKGIHPTIEQIADDNIDLKMLVSG